MIYFVSFYEHNLNLIIQLDKSSIIEFCKNHPDDIICYINKNSIINNESDILIKYYQLNQPLVFSKDFTNTFDKYKYEKIEPYEPCYIGTSKAIIDYYYGKYKTVYDTTIFHVSNQSNINNDTSNYSIITYLPNKPISFLPEIMLFVFICILLKVNHSIISYFLAAIIICVFIEYELYIKHLNIKIQNQILYLLIDAFHIFIQLFLFYLIINFNCNVKKLIFLNIVYFTIVFLFYIFKSCILSIVNNIISNQNVLWGGIDVRIQYFLNLNKSYMNHKIYDDNIGLHSWINGNKNFILAIIALNTYFMIKCKL
jgi:hypothetical protein